MIEKRVALVIVNEKSYGDNEQVSKDLISAGALAYEKATLMNRILWKKDFLPLIVGSVSDKDMKGILKDLTFLKQFNDLKPFTLEQKAVVIPPNKFSEIHNLVKFLGERMKIHENKKSKSKKRKKSK